MEFIKKLFKTSPHTQADIAFNWGNELNGMDDLCAIEHATLQFSVDIKKDVFKDDAFIEALFEIDEKVHTIVDRITTHYINIDHLGMDIEERIANAVFLYHRQVYLIYNNLIENLAHLQPQSLNVMLARAMNNATQMIKWRFYNYQNAPANVWLQLSKIYLVAEKQYLLEEYIRPYPEQEISTLASAYIQACMLGSLESLSFQRRQIDLVSRMLACWAPDILIQSAYIENKHKFYMDTVKDEAAKHIREITPLPSYRYWSFDSVNLKIELGLSLIEYKIVPKQQEMKDIVSNEFSAQTLAILINEWSRSAYNRQRRSVERVKTSKYAHTTYGFEDTCTVIKQNESLGIQRSVKTPQAIKAFDEQLTLQSLNQNINNPDISYLELGATSSKIIDESNKGLGMYSKKLASEVSLGMLLGVTMGDNKGVTNIGVIRSIKNIVGNELHIGIELLSTNAECLVAHIIRVDPNHPKNFDEKSLMDSKPIELSLKENFNEVVSDLGFTCLYLPREFTTPQHNSMQLESLIIPKFHYNKNATYKINISGTELKVKFTEALEHHENWLRVIYTQVIERKMAA